MRGEKKTEEIGPRKQITKSVCKQKNSIFSSRYSNEISMGDGEGKWWEGGEIERFQDQWTMFSLSFLGIRCYLLTEDIFHQEKCSFTVFNLITKI